MGRYTDPPFARGETYFNGDTIDISDLANLGGEILEGREYDFEDSVHGSGATVRCRVVRNMSATAVTAKQLLLPSVAITYPGDYIGRVNGVSDGTAKKVFVADELLPTVGVPQYDLFYVITEGPATVVTPAAGVAVTLGNNVVSTTTGRATVQDMSGATSVLGAQLNNAVGMALATITAGQTAYSLPVWVHRW